jgi:hypothetical protein
MVRPILAVAACAAIALASWTFASLTEGSWAPAIAQDSPGQRLSLDKLADIQAGTYVAGDNLKFVLIPVNGDFLLRLQDSPEIFVLYADHGSLGGRILKYDSDETALVVAVWGGMTLYTDAQPGGLPVVRVGDTPMISPPLIGPGETQNQVNDEARRLNARGLQIAFNVDWNSFNSPLGRAYAFNAVLNAGRGLERYAYSRSGHDMLARRIDSVAAVATGGRPSFALNGRTLVVFFNTGRGFAGCASSRLLVQWLEEQFGQKR